MQNEYRHSADFGAMRHSDCIVTAIPRIHAFFATQPVGSSDLPQAMDAAEM